MDPAHIWTANDNPQIEPLVTQRGETKAHQNKLIGLIPRNTEHQRTVNSMYYDVIPTACVSSCTCQADECVQRHV